MAVCGLVRLQFNCLCSLSVNDLSLPGKKSIFILSVFPPLTDDLAQLIGPKPYCYVHSKLTIGYAGRLRDRTSLTIAKTIF